MSISRTSAGLILLLLALLNIFWYWPGHLYFLNDDLLHIPLTEQGHLFQNNFVRPLHELLVRFDLWLWHKQAYGYHITAMFLHFMVAAQLYKVAQAISLYQFSCTQHKASQIAFWSTAIFLLYPQHAEGIAWILGRTPVLSAVFFMGVLQAFFQAELRNKHYFIGFICFLATLFTYEQAILLPIFLGYLALLQQNIQKRRQQVYFTASMLLAAFLYLIFRKLISVEVVSAYEGKHFLQFNPAVLIANAARILYRLLGSPYLHLRHFYINAAIFILLIVLIVYATRKQIQYKSLCFFIFIIGLLVLPVISLGVTIRSYESGRYLYLPSIFVCMGLAILLVQYQRSKFAWGLVLCWTVYCVFAKWQSGQHYAKASAYAQQVHQQVKQHFDTTKTPLVIDTLHLTIHRLPVFRIAFKQGLLWMNPTLDTNKIQVKYYHDEVTKQYEY